MPKPKQKIFGTNPTRTIVFSFLCIILVGTLLLTLPISSKEREFTSPLKALFTSTSATCVTGLVVVDTGTYWSIFGQIVVLAMIQVGGLGLVTFGAFINFALGKKLGLKSLQLASESVNNDDFTTSKKIVSMVFKISISFELIGALILMTRFIPKYGAYGIYISVFLAISAFCNAGFDVLGFEGKYCSLMNYGDDPIVLTTIMLLIICGGLGFIVWYDLFNYHKSKKLILHSKIVLITTGILLLTGCVVFAMIEWDNPDTIGNMSIPQKFMHAMFQSVTFRTAGFNSVDMLSMHDGTKLLAVVLMFIGAAPGSTGGGIKVTTFAVIVMTVLSVMKSHNDTVIMKRRVEKEVVYKSLAITVLAGVVVICTSSIIGFSNTEHNFGIINVIFETASAMGTVGVSAGVTGMVNNISLVALIITMFLGRVGTVSFAYSITAGLTSKHKNEVIPEGKVIVG